MWLAEKIKIESQIKIECHEIGGQNKLEAQKVTEEKNKKYFISFCRFNGYSQRTIYIRFYRMEQSGCQK